jgi:deoxyadenosine/deoxycytidine kinase
MQRPGGYIAVEGPIGVGKTSLARLLARELNARLVLEEVEDNPFLARFYEDSEKYALPVQLYFLLTRYNQQRALAVGQASSLSTPTGATVADYLLTKDGIFAALNLDPDELSLYQNIQSLLDARTAKPDLVVYMSARVEVLAERLRKRNRDFERYISLDYLEQVSAAFRDFFFNYDETPLLVVETSDIDFVEDSDDLRDLFYEIKSAGRGVQHFVPRKR